MSTLKVNNLQDINGANNSTPEQVAKGRAKAWINFNGTGTPSIVGSFNISSITDEATGTYTITFQNAMVNDNYCAPMFSRANSVTAGVGEQSEVTTTNIKYFSRTSGGVLVDREINGFAVFTD